MRTNKTIIVKNENERPMLIIQNDMENVKSPMLNELNNEKSINKRKFIDQIVATTEKE